MKTWLVLLSLIICGACAPTWAAPNPTNILSRPRATAGMEDPVALARYNWQSFRRLPKAQQRLEPGKYDLVLLDMAVFHETNRRRMQNALEPLVFDPGARQLAQLQSRAMAEQEFVGHENPAEPEKKTLEDRVHVVGLNPSFVAENVASAFGRQYKSGQKYYVREENGQKIYSYTPKGPNIPMHTYISFAEALVDSWMNSPGHRKNILHKSPKYLGCSCEPGKKADDLFTFYCAQNFYAPL